MPDLRSCYFCGDPGESLGTYAVLPPRLNPTEAEQRTVVLCSSCQEKLVKVMEPLVERATAGAAPAGQPVDSGTGDPTPRAEGEDSPAAGRDDATGPDEQRERTVAGGAEGDQPEPASAADEEAGDDPGIGPSDRGITIQATDDAADGSGTDADGPGTDLDGAGTAADLDGPGTDADEPETGAGGPLADSPGSGDGSLPGEYRKVMRLIENREFPMARGDLEAVVTSAYGIDDDQCRQILDAAVERGVLVEDGAKLDRP